MIGRRGFLSSFVAAAFTPAVAVAAQFTLSAPQMTEELAASMRRKAIMERYLVERLGIEGLNTDLIDSTFDSEFSLSRASLEFQARRNDFIRQHAIAQVNDHLFKVWQSCGGGIVT